MTKAPAHRRGAAVTEHLLSSALELVAERGSIELSIEDVAKRAGVNKTTAYRRWPDVNSLIFDAVLAHADTAVSLEPSGDVRSDLVRLCADVVTNLESPIGRALIAAGDSSPDLQAMRAAFWETRLEAAAVLLGDLVTTVAVDLVMERLVGPLHFRILERGLSMPAGAVEELVDHFLRGLSHP